MARTDQSILQARKSLREVENKLKSQQNFKGSVGHDLLKTEISKRKAHLNEMEALYLNPKKEGK